MAVDLSMELSCRCPAAELRGWVVDARGSGEATSCARSTIRTQGNQPRLAPLFPVHLGVRSGLVTAHSLRRALTT